MARRTVCYWLGGARKVSREPVFVCLDLHSVTGELESDTVAIEIPEAFESEARLFADRIAEAFACGALGPNHSEDQIIYDTDSEECFGDV